MKDTTYYDNENDILALHHGFSPDESFKANVDAGDLILDISTKMRVRGIEILNASAFLKEFGITAGMLSHMTGAEFSGAIKPEGIVVGLVVKSPLNPAGVTAKVVAIGAAVGA